MTLTLITSGIKQQKVQIQITSPHDPLILYMLDISEVEFHQIKKEQSLLIDFQNFPSFLIQMLELCNEDESKKYTCILHKTSLYEALLVIQERTDFKELNHLILRVNQANDTIVKKFLGALSMEFKSKYEDTLNAFNNLSVNVDNLNKENFDLKEKMQKNVQEQKNSEDNLINEKNNEINKVKENLFQESKNQIEQMEKEKNSKICDLENKILSLQTSIEELTKEKQELEDNKMKLEINHKDLEGKNAISNTEINVYKEDILKLREDNSNLNQKRFKQEKEITELTFKLQNAEKQLEEKNKGGENLNQLVDTLSKQRESNEDNIKSLKAANLKLEDKLQTSINEINKGNEIIQKLQEEIKNQKSKYKSVKQALSSQEQLTHEKEMQLEDLLRLIEDAKRESDIRDKEISNLKNQLSSYSMKISDNEKIIEDNKQMIMYLNKIKNDNMNFPFRSRFSNNNEFNNNFMSGNNFNTGNIGSSTVSFNKTGNQFNPMNTNNSNINLNNPNNNFNNTSSSNFNTNNNFNTNDNFNTNNNFNSNNNLNPNENIQNNQFSTTNNFNSNFQNQKSYNRFNQNYMTNMPTNMAQYDTTGMNNMGMYGTGDQFSSSQMENIEMGNSTLNNSGMFIMPETNFTNFKAGINNNKYNLMNTANSTSGNLLNHKYGMMASSLTGNNSNDMGSGSRSNSDYKGGYGTYNVEEEFPRHMIQPMKGVNKNI